MKKDEIVIDGETYVKKSAQATDDDNLPVFMVRTYSAGVFYGGLKSRNGKEVLLKNARRVWYWDGAASLSQLSQSGTSKPENCKFPEAVSEVILTEAIELIPVSDKALKSLNSVKIWQK